MVSAWRSIDCDLSQGDDWRFVVSAQWFTHNLVRLSIPTSCQPQPGTLLTMQYGLVSDMMPPCCQASLGVGHISTMILNSETKNPSPPINGQGFLWIIFIIPHPSDSGCYGSAFTSIHSSERFVNTLIHFIPFLNPHLISICYTIDNQEHGIGKCSSPHRLPTEQ